MTPNRTLTLLLAAIACALVLLTACGGGSDSSATATPTAAPTATQASATSTPAPAGSTPDIDECALVTTAELDQIIPSQAFKAGKPNGDFCAFPGTKDAVSIGTADFGTPAAAAQSLQASVNKTASTKVDGLGDVAYWQPTNSQLAITIGKLAMVVDVFTGEGDQSRSDEATAIARIALGRLP
jgi:hypothetical protein